MTTDPKNEVTVDCAVEIQEEALDQAAGGYFDLEFDPDAVSKAKSRKVIAGAVHNIIDGASNIK
jgi:hypothetical protein